MKLETICLHGGAAPDPVTLSRAGSIVLQAAAAK